MTETEKSEQIYSLEWDGISIEITYKKNYISGYDHIDVYASEILPITSTGYRSIFLNEDDIIEANGVVNYIERLLNQAAESKDWQTHKQERRQTSLF